VEALGTGAIPRNLIIGKPKTRQAGIADVVDTAKIRHVSGGISHLNLKTYEQGWRLWQGAAPDLIWMDEQPDENTLNEKGIFTEAQTRVFRSGGLIYLTLTPLLGETEMIRHFSQPKAKGIWMGGATWDDAPHLNEEDKERLRLTYPAHELDARTKGIPMLGEGRVFTVGEETITCPPFNIREFPWYRVICGVDFGIDHPAAGCWLAHDADADVIYVYDAYRMAGETAIYHAAAIKAKGNDIPVAWPHDGMNREKKGAETLADSYRVHGANMLPLSARYDRKVGGAQPVEPIVNEMLERMKTGRFKVMASVGLFLEEFRSYHRKDGKIVAARDDVLKAAMYGLMMLRYAAPRMGNVRNISTNSRPTVSLRA